MSFDVKRFRFGIKVWVLSWKLVLNIGYDIKGLCGFFFLFIEFFAEVNIIVKVIKRFLK